MMNGTGVSSWKFLFDEYDPRLDRIKRCLFRFLMGTSPPLRTTRAGVLVHIRTRWGSCVEQTPVIKHLLRPPRKDLSSSLWSSCHCLPRCQLHIPWSKEKNGIPQADGGTRVMESPKIRLLSAVKEGTVETPAIDRKCDRDVFTWSSVARGGGNTRQEYIVTCCCYFYYRRSWAKMFLKTIIFLYQPIEELILTVKKITEEWDHRVNTEWRYSHYSDLFDTLCWRYRILASTSKDLTRISLTGLTVNGKVAFTTEKKQRNKPLVESNEALKRNFVTSAASKVNQNSTLWLFQNILETLPKSGSRYD